MAPKPPILPGKYQYVKRLEVFPERSSIFDRCSHGDNRNDASRNEASAVENGARGGDNDNTLERKYPYDWITEMASAVADDKLDIFRWDMKTCVPGSLLGTHGVIALKQRSLRRLLLETASCCYLRNVGTFFNREPNQMIDLSGFRMLEQIDWTTPNAVFIATLSIAIKQNVGHLRRLHLHFEDWKRFEPRIREVQFLANVSEDEPIEVEFANRLFNAPSLKEYPTRHLFPELRDLFLSDVPLSRELASAIDFQSLQSLGLHSCPGWDQFLLRSLGELETHQKLKTLEIRDDWIEPTTIERILNQITSSISRLEALFLNHLAPVGTLKMWENIARYQGDLRHFVHHQRQITPKSTKSCLYGMGEDFGSLSLPSEELIDQQFSGLNLESIGLSCEPKYFLKLLPSLRKMSSLKVIHIRRSYYDYQDCWAAFDDKYHMRKLTPGTLRPEFREFIETVFGAEGLPSVEVIVYGQTSYCGLYIFERSWSSSSGDAHWLEDNPQHKALMDKYRHTFEACRTRTRRLGIPATGSI
ncbi:unnamed protein product [Clonostachys byssicola]|uniref:Uncharacterized protein n=1 Tax=Clonostachys byssicola TaxID=160290 RepID=A0A9N9XUT6_9HYPO|nr:unnamed protein product [Clonostachys byssicola]